MTSDPSNNGEGSIVPSVFTRSTFYIDETDPPLTPGTQGIYVNYALGEDPEKERLLARLKAHPATRNTEEEMAFVPWGEEDKRILESWRRNPVVAFDVPLGWFSENMTVLTIPDP